MSSIRTIGMLLMALLLWCKPVASQIYKQIPASLGSGGVGFLGLSCPHKTNSSAFGVLDGNRYLLTLDHDGNITDRNDLSALKVINQNEKVVSIQSFNKKLYLVLDNDTNQSRRLAILSDTFKVVYTSKLPYFPIAGMAILSDNMVRLGVANTVFITFYDINLGRRVGSYVATTKIGSLVQYQIEGFEQVLSYSDRYDTLTFAKLNPILNIIDVYTETAIDYGAQNSRFAYSNGTFSYQFFPSNLGNDHQGRLAIIRNGTPTYIRYPSDSYGAFVGSDMINVTETDYLVFDRNSIAKVDQSYTLTSRFGALDPLEHRWLTGMVAATSLTGDVALGKVGYIAICPLNRRGANFYVKSTTGIPMEPSSVCFTDNGDLLVSYSETTSFQSTYYENGIILVDGKTFKEKKRRVFISPTDYARIDDVVFNKRIFYLLGGFLWTIGPDLAGPELLINIPGINDLSVQNSNLYCYSAYGLSVYKVDVNTLIGGLFAPITSVLVSRYDLYGGISLGFHVLPDEGSVFDTFQLNSNGIVTGPGYYAGNFRGNYVLRNGLEKYVLPSDDDDDD